MSTRPIRYVLSIAAWCFGLLSVLIGMVFLMSGVQHYINKDYPESHPFAQVLLAMGFLGLPLSFLLLYKARHGLKHRSNDYELPVPPMNSLGMGIIGTALLIAATAAFILVWLFF